MTTQTRNFSRQGSVHPLLRVSGVLSYQCSTLAGWQCHAVKPCRAGRPLVLISFLFTYGACEPGFWTKSCSEILQWWCRAWSAFQGLANTVVSWWWEKGNLYLQADRVWSVTHKAQTPMSVLCVWERERILFNVWFLDTNCSTKQTCFWNNVIVLFPLKENSFSYHCEVNNSFGSEKLAREQVLTFHVLYLKSPRSDASLLGLG